jgi:hypothetical protein
MHRWGALSVTAALSFALLASGEPCIAVAQVQSVAIADIADHPGQAGAIKRMVSQGVIPLASPGKFAPDEPVTVREFAASVQRLFGLKPTSGEQRFDDVPPTDPDYATINSIAGYMNRQAFCPGCLLNRNLNPNQPISQVQQAVILTSLLIARHQLTLVSPEDAGQILASAPDTQQIAEPARRFLATAVRSSILPSASIAQIPPVRRASRADTATLLDNTQRLFAIQLGR